MVLASLFTWPAMSDRLLLIPVFWALNCWERELSLSLNAWALVSVVWRDASSVGVVDTLCSELKNFCNEAVMPVLVSDSMESVGVTWARYEDESLLSEVEVCNCASR